MGCDGRKGEATLASAAGAAWASGARKGAREVSPSAPPHARPARRLEPRAAWSRPRWGVPTTPWGAGGQQRLILTREQPCLMGAAGSDGRRSSSRSPIGMQGWPAAGQRLGGAHSDGPRQTLSNVIAWIPMKMVLRLMPSTRRRLGGNGRTTSAARLAVGILNCAFPPHSRTLEHETRVQAVLHYNAVRSSGVVCVSQADTLVE